MSITEQFERRANRAFAEMSGRTLIEDLTAEEQKSALEFDVESKARFVRTAAGVRRFKRPIGAIILPRTGLSLDRIRIKDPVFQGFHLVEDRKGNLFDVGKDDSTGKFVALKHNTWDDQIEPVGSLDDALESLNEKLGGGQGADKVEDEKPAKTPKPKGKTPSKPDLSAEASARTKGAIVKAHRTAKGAEKRLANIEKLSKDDPAEAKRLHTALLNDLDEQIAVNENLSKHRSTSSDDKKTLGTVNDSLREMRTKVADRDPARATTSSDKSKARTPERTKQESAEIARRLKGAQDALDKFESIKKDPYAQSSDYSEYDRSGKPRFAINGDFEQADMWLRNRDLLEKFTPEERTQAEALRQRMRDAAAEIEKDPSIMKASKSRAQERAESMPTFSDEQIAQARKDYRAVRSLDDGQMRSFLALNEDGRKGYIKAFREHRNHARAHQAGIFEQRKSRGQDPVKGSTIGGQGTKERSAFIDAHPAMKDVLDIHKPKLRDLSEKNFRAYMNAVEDGKSPNSIGAIMSRVAPQISWNPVTEKWSGQGGTKRPTSPTHTGDTSASDAADAAARDRVAKMKEQDRAKGRTNPYTSSLTESQRASVDNLTPGQYAKYMNQRDAGHAHFRALAEANGQADTDRARLDKIKGTRVTGTPDEKVKKFEDLMKALDNFDKTSQSDLGPESRKVRSNLAERRATALKAQGDAKREKARQEAEDRKRQQAEDSDTMKMHQRANDERRPYVRLENSFKAYSKKFQDGDVPNKRVAKNMLQSMEENIKDRESRLKNPRYSSDLLERDVEARNRHIAEDRKRVEEVRKQVSDMPEDGKPAPYVPSSQQGAKPKKGGWAEGLGAAQVDAVNRLNPQHTATYMAARDRGLNHYQAFDEISGPGTATSSAAPKTHTGIFFDTPITNQREVAREIASITENAKNASRIRSESTARSRIADMDKSIALLKGLQDDKDGPMTARQRRDADTAIKYVQGVKERLEKKFPQGTSSDAPKDSGRFKPKPEGSAPSAPVGYDERPGDPGDAPFRRGASVLRRAGIEDFTPNQARRLDEMTVAERKRAIEQIQGGRSVAEVVDQPSSDTSSRDAKPIDIGRFGARDEAEARESHRNTPVYSMDQIPNGRTGHIGDGVWIKRCPVCGQAFRSLGSPGYSRDYARHVDSHGTGAEISGYNAPMMSSGAPSAPQSTSSGAPSRVQEDADRNRRNSVLPEDLAAQQKYGNQRQMVASNDEYLKSIVAAGRAGTAESLRAETQERIAEIERRLQWTDRELGGYGLGAGAADSQRDGAQLRERLTGHRDSFKQALKIMDRMKSSQEEEARRNARPAPRALSERFDNVKARLDAKGEAIREEERNFERTGGTQAWLNKVGTVERYYALMKKYQDHRDEIERDLDTTQVDANQSQGSAEYSKERMIRDMDHRINLIQISLDRSKASDRAKERARAKANAPTAKERQQERRARREANGEPDPAITDNSPAREYMARQQENARPAGQVERTQNTPQERPAGQSAPRPFFSRNGRREYLDTEHTPEVQERERFQRNLGRILDRLPTVQDDEAEGLAKISAEDAPSVSVLNREIDALKMLRTQFGGDTLQDGYQEEVDEYINALQALVRKREKYDSAQRAEFEAANTSLFDGMDIPEQAPNMGAAERRYRKRVDDLVQSMNGVSDPERLRETAREIYTLDLPDGDAGYDHMADAVKRLQKRINAAYPNFNATPVRSETGISREEAAARYANTPSYTIDQIPVGRNGHVGNGQWVTRCSVCGKPFISNGSVVFNRAKMEHEATHGGDVPGINVGLLP